MIDVLRYCFGSPFRFCLTMFVTILWLGAWSHRTMTLTVIIKRRNVDAKH